MDGTITKLRTHVEEFEKNIEGEIMPNNIQLVYNNIEKIFQKELSDLRVCSEICEYDEEYVKRTNDLKKKQYDIKESMRSRIQQNYRSVNHITLKEFIDNMDKVDEETKKIYTLEGDKRNGKELVTIKPEIKIYHDIIPIFTTMIGIMKKQQDEINMLKGLMIK